MNASGASVSDLPKPMIGAVIFRRTADGWWCVDEFAHDGRYLGSHSSNWSQSPVTVTKHVAWPIEALRLADLKIPPSMTKRQPREGLVRCIDGEAASRA